MMKILTERGSRLSTGNRRLGDTVFPVDGIGPCCCSCIQIFFILLRGALAGITHELPCPRVHRSLLTKTIKLNDASSDASPGQKLVFFLRALRATAALLLWWSIKRFFGPPGAEVTHRGSLPWVTSRVIPVGHFCAFFQNVISFICLGLGSYELRSELES